MCSGLFKLIGFPGVSVSKEFACNSEELYWIPGWGDALEKGNGNLIQFSCLGNSMDRETWRATVQQIRKNWTRLNN